MEKRFEGKTAVVTGSAAGIGRGVAYRLGREGAFIVAADIDGQKGEETAEALRKEGIRCSFRKTDVSRPDDLKALAEETFAEHGRLDIFVHAAGVVKNQLLLDVTEADWDRVIDINQKGTAFAVQAAAAVMLRQVPDSVKSSGRSDRSYGKIVVFSSISGRRGRPLQLHYAASKAAVISITQSAALVFAPYGINVNAVAPSVVQTPMWEQVDREKAEIFGMKPGEAFRDIVEKVPLKRPGTVEDMAAAVAFLCSTDADYITGQTLNVDGGFEMN